MGGGNLMILVLDQVQMLDQQVAPPRPVAEQKLDLMRGGRVDLTSLGGRFGPLASFARMLEGADLLHIITHSNVPSVVFSPRFYSLACHMPIGKDVAEITI